MMQIVIGGLDRTFPLWLNGIAGVDIFFVLSGFVMIVSSERLETRRDGWRTFVRRRILRIFPMYWVVSLAFFTAVLVRYLHVVPFRALAWWLTGSLAFLPVREPFGLIYPVLSVGWTLVFEMFFYAIFALALFLRANVMWFVGVTLALVSTASHFRRANWLAISYYLDPIVLEFLAGMMIAKLCQRRRTVSPFVGFLSAALGLLYIVFSNTPPLPARALYLGVPAAVTVFAVASMEPWLQKTPALLLFFSDVSFVLYLVHEPIAQVVTKSMKASHMNHAIAAFCITILVSVLTASLLRVFVEVPLQRRLKLAFGWANAG